MHVHGVLLTITLLGCKHSGHELTQADKTQIDRLLNRGEQKLREYAHPDPYIGKQMHTVCTLQLPLFLVLLGCLCSRQSFMLLCRLTIQQSGLSDCYGVASCLCLINLMC